MVIHNRKIEDPLSFLLVGFFIVLLCMIFSCLPFERITKVRTDSSGNPTSNSCIVNGTIVDIGEEGINQHGHCWSIAPNPSISNDKTDLGPRLKPGSYISNLTDLAPNQKYFVKAYAIDNNGEHYGLEISFTTLAIPIPAAPSNLVAEPVSKSQINLSWTNNADNAVGFSIERSPNGNTSWSEIETLGADTTTFLDINLSSGTTYYYRVRAFNADGNSDYSNIASATTRSDIPVPATPTNCAADAESSSQITISWTDNANNEEGFIIERSLDGTNWEVIDTVGADVTNFQEMNLFPSTDYYYRVRAYNAGGNSDYSDPAYAKTLSDGVTEPTAPTELVAEAISNSQIKLTWIDMSDNEEGFRIERAGESMNWREIDSVEADTVTYLNVGLTSSVTYFYRVRAYNSGGNSEYSNIDSAKTLSGVTKPAAPTDLIAEAVSSSQINLSWTDNSDNEEGFLIERSVNNLDWFEIASVGSDVTVFQNRDLTASTQYYYRIRAYNPGGNSDYSNTDDATTLSDIPVPAAPTNLIAAAISDSRIDLSWTDNADNEDGFRIERSPDGSNWEEIAIVGSDITTFQNMDLAHSTVYYYRVRAYNAGANSDYSNTAYAETSPCPGYLLIDHIAGDVAPVTETNIRYGVVETNLSGENKCWIKQNLGAHYVAGGPTDDNQNVAGWYWQFNRKQGYKHDGVTRTPSTSWINPIFEDSEWQAANDPCTILFGRGWRIPTQMEWTNADNYGGWNNYTDPYASDLKLHAAGALEFNTGELYARGSGGLYWSTTQISDSRSWFLIFDDINGSMMEASYKSLGLSIRCIKD